MPDPGAEYVVSAVVTDSYVSFQCKVWASSEDDARRAFTKFVTGVREFRGDLTVEVTNA